MADVTKDQVVDFLSKMTVLDLAALTKELEDKWGVKAANRGNQRRIGTGASVRYWDHRNKTELNLQGVSRWPM